MADLKRATNSVSQENTEDPKFALATEGLYRHPDTGAELAAFYDPIAGNAQAQGYTRVGFERVGDVPTGYDKTAAPSFASDTAKGPVVENEDALKGVMARLRELESDKQLAEATAARANDKSADEAPELQAEKVQQDAADNVAAQQTASPVGVNASVQDEGSKVKKGSK